MMQQEDNKPSKKRKARQLYEAVLKSLNEECDKLQEELNKPFTRHKDLIAEKEKSS